MARSKTETLTPMFHHHDERAQYYAVAVSSSGIVAAGRSDARVRLFDARGKNLNRGPLRVFAPAARITSIAIDADQVVAATRMDVSRIDLGSGRIASIATRVPINAIALSGDAFAIAADNCIAGTVAKLDSYCNMPIARDEAFGAVALSSDGLRVAAYRLASSYTEGKITLAGYTNDVHASPPSQPARAWKHTLDVRRPGSGPSSWLPPLGWLGTAVVVAERGSNAMSLVGGQRARRLAWPAGFVAAEIVFSDASAIAIDAKGQLALALPDLTTRRVAARVAPPVANVAISRNGRYLAYAAGFQHCSLYDLGAVLNL